MPNKPDPDEMKLEWKNVSNKDDEAKRRLEEWYNNLPEEQRNPNAKETFDKLIRRAARPLPAKPGTKPRSGGYNAK